MPLCTLFSGWSTSRRLDALLPGHAVLASRTLARRARRVVGRGLVTATAKRTPQQRISSIPAAVLAQVHVSVPRVICELESNRSRARAWRFRQVSP